AAMQTVDRDRIKRRGSDTVLKSMIKAAVRYWARAMISKFHTRVSRAKDAIKRLNRKYLTITPKLLKCMRILQIIAAPDVKEKPASVCACRLQGFRIRIEFRSCP